jgi:hypothetical protein
MCQPANVRVEANAFSMEATSEPKSTLAWQPLTVRGVAGFARASLTRLLLVQFVVASVVAATALWLLNFSWVPVITESIRRLPSDAHFGSGQLTWSGPASQRLVENHFFAITLDAKHGGLLRSPAHVQAEFGRSDLRIHSLLGFIQLSYPDLRPGNLNRSDLQAWWGAWTPVVLTFLAGMIVVMLLVTWALLALVYSLPVKIVAFFADRELNWREARHLSGAALLPGAIFMALAIIGYGLAWLDPIHLLLAFALHFAIPWLYLLLSPFNLARAPATPDPKANPFTSVPPSSPRAEIAGSGSAEDRRS